MYQSPAMNNVHLAYLNHSRVNLTFCILCSKLSQLYVISECCTMSPEIIYLEENFEIHLVMVLPVMSFGSARGERASKGEVGGCVPKVSGSVSFSRSGRVVAS